jgi:hypothetical protein
MKSMKDGCKTLQKLVSLPAPLVFPDSRATLARLVHAPRDAGASVSVAVAAPALRSHWLIDVLPGTQ